MRMSKEEMISAQNATNCEIVIRSHPNMEDTVIITPADWEGSAVRKGWDVQYMYGCGCFKYCSYGPDGDGPRFVKDEITLDEALYLARRYFSTGLMRLGGMTPMHSGLNMDGRISMALKYDEKTWEILMQEEEE